MRFPLEDLGFPGVSNAFLAQGGSMLTIHFVDGDHVLLTYSLRGLVKRVEHDRAGDEDRMVAGELIEVPTGKVLARTEWRLHDHGRYLWNLGNGRFLLRTQNSLSTFAPLANLASGKAFDRTSFPPRPGSIEAIVVSSDNKLLTVETSRPQAQTVDDPQAEYEARLAASRPHFTSSAAEPPPPTPPPAPAPARSSNLPPVTLDFYRLSGTGSFDQPLVAQGAGAIGTSSVASLPIDSDGYLRTDDKSRGHWAISFHAFSGKEIPLSSIDTSCPPTVQRVSPSQFLSINCHGSLGGLVLAAYDFEKHEIWEEPLDVSPLPPTFSFAPSSGRFAVSRVHSVSVQGASAGLPDATESQDVRIYQTQTGDMLLKVDASPVFKTAENFDLSPDGMRLAVIRKGALEIYRLPELTKLDIDDLAQLDKLAPPPGVGRIDLTSLAATAETESATQTAEAVSISVSGEAPPAPANASGDSQGPRKRPTLLNPGEKPEFKDKNPSPTD